MRKTMSYPVKAFFYYDNLQIYALASTTHHPSSSFQVGVLPRVKIRLVPQNDKQKKYCKNN